MTSAVPPADGVSGGDLESARTRAGDVQRLARGSGPNLAGSVVAAAFNLVLPVLITRGLAQEDAGVFFQATVLFTILINVGAIGADTGVVREIPRALARSKPRDVVALLRTSLVVPLVVSVLLAIGWVVLRGPTAALIGGDGSSAGFERVVVVLALFLPPAVVYVVGLAATRGLGSVRPLVTIEKLGRGAAQLAAVGVAVTFTGSIVLVVLAWSLPYVAALVVVGMWIVRRVRAVSARLPDTSEEASTPGIRAEFWRFSAPSAGSRIFRVVLQRVDIVIVGALLGPKDAALYAVATRFPIFGLMFVQAIQQVMAPRISAFLASDQRDRAQHMYQTTTMWLLLASWPLYLISVWFAPLLLSIFGRSYADASEVVVILCLTMLVATACGPVDSVLLMGGRSGLSLVNTGLALAITVGLDLLLIPVFGITGAAMGWAVGILVNNLIPLWQVHHHLNMHPVGRGTRLAVLVALVSFGLVPGVSRLTLGVTVTGLAVGTLAGAAVFGLGAFRWRRDFEVDALLNVVRRRGAGARPRATRAAG